MIQALVLSILVSLVTPALGAAGERGDRDKVVGSGEIVTETIELEVYTSIDLRIVADMNVTIGKATPLTIEVDDNILPLIKIEVVKGTLVISTEHKFKTKKAPNINITVAQLDAVSVKGASDVHVTKLDNETLTVSVTGAADIFLSGKTDTLTLSATGAADVHAFELASKSASVSITGAADANISVDDSLIVNIVGAGDLNYKGNAKVTKQIVGNGDVNKVRAEKKNKV